MLNVRPFLLAMINKNYDRKIYFIAALPKSGSTWLEQFMTKLENIIVRPINGDSSVIMNHNIEDGAFNCFPILIVS